jgi:predicted GNAT family N-acyltransferase
MITKLYKINNSNKKELNKTCELFTNNFVNKPQYQKISKNQNKIKELIKIQINTILQNKNNSIEIYSNDKKLNSIIILINAKDKPYTKQIFSNKNTIKQFKQINKQFSLPQTLKIIFQTIQTNNIYKKLINQTDYILYTIVVDEKEKGQGHATKLIKPILNKFDNEKLSISLNTHQINNIHIYEHFGFKLHNIKTEKKLKKYQMIRKPQINKIRVKKQY